MDIIKLEKFIYLQKVNCDFFEYDDNLSFGNTYQLYLLLTNKSIYFLREYDNNTTIKKNMEVFLKINHYNFNCKSYFSINSEILIYIQTRNNLINIRLSEIEVSKRKSFKTLAIILAIFDGYKIICLNENKNLDDYIDWLIYVINSVCSQNKLIIDEEFFKNIDLNFLADMVYFLCISLEFEIKLNLLFEENIIKLNYILKDCSDEIYQTINNNNRTNNNINKKDFHYIINRVEKNENDYFDETSMIRDDNSKLGYLNTLKFSYNFLNDNYFIILFSNLENSLVYIKELEISNNNITQNIIPILNQCFRCKNKSSLQKLILNNNRIYGKGLERDLFNLLNLVNLKLIDLSNNLLDNEFLFNFDNYLHERYYESLNNKNISYNIFSGFISSQDPPQDNNINDSNNKVMIIFNKNLFENENKNKNFYKIFLKNINTKINDIFCENLDTTEDYKNENFMLYSVKQFLDNTSYFKHKISFIFDTHLIKDSKILISNANNNKESLDFPIFTRLDNSNIKLSNIPVNISGNLIFSNKVKKELNLTNYIIDKSNNNNKKLKNSNSHNLIFFMNSNNKSDINSFVKNYEIETESSEINNIHDNKNIFEIYQDFNDLLFLTDYLFDEKLNGINYEINKEFNKKTLNFNDIFYPTFFEIIEKNFLNHEKERKNIKNNFNLYNDTGIFNSNITLNKNKINNFYNSNNSVTNKNSIYIVKSNFDREKINNLFKKHFIGKEIDNFHPNANVIDLKIFFMAFKKLNKLNYIMNKGDIIDINNKINITNITSILNFEKIKIPINSLNKFLKRVKINVIYSLKYNDLFSLDILEDMCKYFNLNFLFRVKVKKNILESRADIINNALKSIINFKGHSNKFYKDKYYLHTINNFLDIFLNLAEEINLKNEIILIAKYLKMKRDIFIHDKLKNIYINISLEDKLLKTNKFNYSESNQENNKFLNKEDNTK